MTSSSSSSMSSSMGGGVGGVGGRSRTSCTMPAGSHPNQMSSFSAASDCNSSFGSSVVTGSSEPTPPATSNQTSQHHYTPFVRNSYLYKSAVNGGSTSRPDPLSAASQQQVGSRFYLTVLTLRSGIVDVPVGGTALTKSIPDKSNHNFKSAFCLARWKKPSWRKKLNKTTQA